MSKLQHVEGIGLIDLSEVTFISEFDYSDRYSVFIGSQAITLDSVPLRERLIEAIEEHDKFFYGSVE